MFHSSREYRVDAGAACTAAIYGATLDAPIWVISVPVLHNESISGMV